MSKEEEKISLKNERGLWNIKLIVPKFPGQEGYVKRQCEIKCRLVWLQVIDIYAIVAGKGGSEGSDL